MIPKTIHYCWFGGNPLPESAKNCIASWEKFCPDYKIIEWNESNFDFDDCDYAKQAYAEKKWAFVSDYARFKILYEQGGLYFDTDVELVKNIDDIISKGSFMGRESEAAADVAPGLGLGAEAGLAFYEQILDFYRSISFLNADGTQNLKTVVDYTTRMLTAKGLSCVNEVQKIENIYIYPKEYFCPLDYFTGELNTTENTRSIHHYSATWYNEKQKYSLALKRKYSKFMPRKLASVSATAVAIIKFDGFGSFLKWVFKKRK